MPDNLIDHLPEDIQAKLAEEMEVINSDVDFDPISTEHGIRNFTDNDEILDGLPRRWQSAPKMERRCGGIDNFYDGNSLKNVLIFGKE